MKTAYLSASTSKGDMADPRKVEKLLASGWGWSIIYDNDNYPVFAVNKDDDGKPQYRWLFSSRKDLQGHLTVAKEQEILELMNQGHPAPVSITLDLGCEVKTTLDIHPAPGGKSPSYTRRITELELGEKGGAKDE